MFKFKIWDHIEKAWPIYKKNFGVLFLLSAVTVIISSMSTQDHWVTGILYYLVVSLLTFIWIKYSLSLVDANPHDFFTKKTLPTLKQYWNLAKTIILVFVIIFFGLIFLIIPGLYISGRLIFAVYLSVEKKQGARKSISDSWEMTKENGWKLFWKSLIIALFMVIGFIFFGVGALVTYPIGYLVLSMMYRDFHKFKSSENKIKNKKDEGDEKDEIEQVVAEKITE